ncbi:universal stress protein [Halorientalis marina]|jgi:nucleotide-binding universal stress UspA family protein|uniref:universal stress protein n=1 Tax=Halorientalis marina TaxID=2931976 RepID=UPI001FF360DA|nr:universal stress protein [Halorientalis marina]
MSDVFERVLLPVANDDDAEASCRAIEPYVGASVVACNVVEKAGGAPDKASVEQRELVAEDAFAVVRDRLGDVTEVETTIRYDTDVADAIFDAAADVDATAIIFTPRGGSRWLRLLTGDVAMDLVNKTDRPVVVLPDVSEEE